jgi:hypothetical protein
LPGLRVEGFGGNVEHRHLLPDEIDLLLDGEVGFGVAPLQAHVDRCDHCRAEVNAARALIAALEEVPHFSPSPLFAERVMTRVQVFEPWHVSALDTAKRWLPRSAPGRVLAAASLGFMALTLSVSAVWLAVRVDALLFFFNIATERTRSWATGAIGRTLAEAFGQSALDALHGAGPAGIAIGLAAFLILLIAAAFGLRAVAVTAGRRRA